MSRRRPSEDRDICPVCSSTDTRREIVHRTKTRKNGKQSLCLKCGYTQARPFLKVKA